MAFSRTIFLTGFPGFIAERLVARLAKEEFQFFLLVQHAFLDQAVEAAKQISDDTRTPIENFAVIEGDITQPDWDGARRRGDSPLRNHRRFSPRRRLRSCRRT